METNKLMLGIAILATIALIGCVQSTPTATATPMATTIATPTAVASDTPTATPAANDATPTPASESKQATLEDIFKYGSISEFEYRTMASGSTTNIKTRISSDTVDGKAAWLTSVDMSTEGVAASVNTWVDKATYSCLKMASVVTVNGQNMETPSECPKEGANAPGRTEMPKATFKGTESVTVPAGTYTADKWDVEGITYYQAAGVPIPVKVTYADASVVMELVSFKQ